MTADSLTSVRELNGRLTNGLQVRLLWCQIDQRLSVAVIDTRTGEAFRIDVRDDERPLDVFDHPYAYAAHRGIDTHVPVGAIEIRDPDREVLQGSEFRVNGAGG